MAEPAGLAPDGQRLGIADIIEAAWLPALLALITATSTWLIWYYTHTVCTPEIAALTGCNAGSAAKYISVDVFGRMLTYGSVVGGIGGFWRYDMIRKERAARIAAENRLAEVQKQREEDRVKNEAIREEDRQAFMARLEEERQRAADDQQAFLAALSELTAEIAHLRQQRNGNGQNGH